jgi:hypothetical protein
VSDHFAIQDDFLYDFERIRAAHRTDAPVVAAPLEVTEVFAP